MIYPDYKYVDVAFNGVHTRNNIQEAVKVRLPSNVVDCYRTVYRYPEELKQHAERNKGSVSGYAGPVFADFLPIDVDSEDLEQAHVWANRLLNMLLNNYEVDLNHLRIFFSGSKGFHIMLPWALFEYEPCREMPLVFKKMAPVLAEGITIDPVIYDRVRLFRFSNTINSKSGLYKIPLTPAEILNMSTDEIKELAKAPRKVEAESAEEPNVYLRTLYLDTLAKIKQPPESSAADGVKQKGIKPPKGAKLCYYKILEGVGEGGRDNTGLRLAVHFLKEFPAEVVLQMLHGWNKRNRPPMKPENVDKLFKQAQGEYDFGCNDPLLMEYCQDSCLFKKKEAEKRVTADKIYSLDEARDKYLEYIKKLDERKITLGYDKIDRAIRGIAPGEVCEVMARTGVGKTAFLLNVIKNVIIKHHVPVLFFSLEQPLAQIYERVAQISKERTGQEVEKAYAAGDSSYHEIAKLNYKQLYVVEEDMLTYEELKAFIELAAAEKIGEVPPLVCVDYLGRMKGGGGNAYEITSELARMLKALAKEMDIALLYLHQTSRMGKTGAEDITLDMARDSGVVEEAADFIIGMWRPEINDVAAQESDRESIQIAILKNRKGRLGKSEYTFVKPHLRIIDESAAGETPPWESE